MKRWLETDYPSIRRRAKRAGARIFFADEAGVRSDYHSGTTWGKRGQTPVVSSTGARLCALFRAVLKGSRVDGPLHECEISRALRELAPTDAGLGGPGAPADWRTTMDEQSEGATLADVEELAAITCCPRCRAAVQPGAEQWHCTAPDCDYAQVGFPVVLGQPVLVDFARSIFLRASYERGSGSVLPRDDSGRGLRTRLRMAAEGHNPVAARMCQTMLRLARKRTPLPLVLVMGGGAVGSGVAALYADEHVRLGSDVYASANTRLIGDGHALPFRDGVFDAVLIQAVLEHVLEPQRVVDEIRRVLHPDGLVYAETPFMQQVHEGAYDFTRFTRSGHRWLFRRFTEIESGSVGGAGVALLWSIRYYVRALGAGNQLATLATMPFVWLRLLERFARPQQNADAASGHYFLGRRAEAQALRETDMVAYYESQGIADRALASAGSPGAPRR